MKAIIYTTTTCAFCPMVKKYLTSKGIDYIEKDAEDLKIREEAFKVSGAATVPVTVLNGKVIVGWNVKQLAEAINGN